MRQLPDSWRWVAFQDVAKVAADLKDPALSPEALHLAPNHIESNTGKLKALRTVAEDGVTSPKHVFRAGQIVYSKIRPYLAKATIPRVSGLCSADMYPIEAAISDEFLLYWMLCPEFTEMASAHQGRSVLPKINQAALVRLPVPVPPLEEQRRIACSLEEAFSKLDAGESALCAVRLKLKRMRDAILAAAVTGELVPQDPTDTPTATFLADRGVECIRDDNLETLPPSWAWVLLGSISDIGGGIQKQPKRAPRNNPVPFLRVANVGRRMLDLQDVHLIELFEGELTRYGLCDGDLLVVEGNGSPEQIGRSSLWRGVIDPCVHQNHLIRVRPKQSLVPEYLEFYWNSPHASRRVQAVASSTSGLHTLSTGKLKMLPIAIPPLTEQSRIVTEVERELSVLDACERAVDAGVARSAALRRSVLKAAFEGRLVSQDPSDEPASVMLERIRAERAVSGPTKSSRGRKKVETV